MNALSSPNVSPFFQIIMRHLNALFLLGIGLLLGLPAVFSQPNQSPQSISISHHDAGSLIQDTPTFERRTVVRQLPGKEIQFHWDLAMSSWAYDSTHLYQYDSEGNPVFEQRVDTVNNLDLSRYFRAFNADNKVISDSSERWLSNMWTPNLDLKFQYYSNPPDESETCWQIVDPLLKELLARNWNADSMVWDTLANWEFTITFSPSGPVLDWIWSFWSPDSNRQLNFARESKVYSAEGWLTKRTCQSWNAKTMDWENTNQTEYALKPSGRLDQVIVSKWDDILNQWLPVYRLHRVQYDISERIEQYERQNWINDDWVDLWSFQFLYESDSISHSLIRRKRQNALWVNDRRTRIFYDQHGTLSLNITQNWDTDFAKWETNSGNEFLNFYDSEGRMTEQIRRKWNLRDGLMENQGRSLFLDFQAIGNVANSALIQEGVSIYPNPANSTVILRWERSGALQHWEVYDLSGQLLIRRQIAEGSQAERFELDVEPLARGMYLLRATSESGTWSGRLVKE